MKATISTLTIILATLSLTACTSVAPPLSQQASLEQCQKEGGQMMWKGSIKRCVYNDLFEQKPADSIVLVGNYNGGVGKNLSK